LAVDGALERARVLVDLGRYDDADPLLAQVASGPTATRGCSPPPASLVFDAVNRSYQVVVPSDAVAGTPAEYGWQVIDNCLRLLATVVTTDDLVATWKP
jgi:hypothetical protein